MCYSIHTIDDPIEIATGWESKWNSIDFSQSDIKILIHGWNANSDHISMLPVRNAYLKRNESHVMAIDWREIAELPYIVARDLIAKVGREICMKLRKFFSQFATTIDVNRVHIVGHSLGCHIATHVGRCFNGEIGR